MVAILNPNPEMTQVDLTFTRADGQPAVTQSFVLQPTSRLSVDANKYVPDAEISMRVTADTRSWSSARCTGARAPPMRPA